jgi:hypothetical protein
MAQIAVVQVFPMGGRLGRYELAGLAMAAGMLLVGDGEPTYTF